MAPDRTDADVEGQVHMVVDHCKAHLQWGSKTRRIGGGDVLSREKVVLHQQVAGTVASRGRAHDRPCACGMGITDTTACACLRS